MRTTDAVKPYNSAEHVDLAGDAALLHGIHEHVGEKPALLTSRTALREYEREGGGENPDPLAAVAEGNGWDDRDAGYFGDLLGSNDYAETRLGAVIGANHYGDGFIERWSALTGETADATRSRNAGERGTDLSYGCQFADDELTHMMEHGTLQRVMRFGRDGGGALVFVHTNTLPEWVPLAGEGRTVCTRSDGERQVLCAAASLTDAGREAWTTADLAAHPDVDVFDRQVRSVCRSLCDRGVFADAPDPDDGRRTAWHLADGTDADANVDALTAAGGDFDATDIPDAPSGTDTPAGGCGNFAYGGYYTWNCRKIGSLPPDASPPTDERASNPPPDDADATADGPPPG